MPSRWPHEGTARGARQWPTLERLIERVEASPALDGMILLGSFARGKVDALSDLDLVLVECLLATASSGVRLAEPAAVLAGDRGLLDRFPRRPPVTRAEMAAHPLDLHPVERAYDQLKEAVRRTLSPGLGGRGPRGR